MYSVFLLILWALIYALVAVVHAETIADDITVSTNIGESASTLENNPFHRLGWVPYALLSAKQREQHHPLCDGQYLSRHFSALPDEEWRIGAADFSGDADHGVFFGNVRARRGALLLESEEMRWDLVQDQVDLPSSGGIYSDSFSAAVARARWHVTQGVITTEKLEFVFPHTHWRGGGGQAIYDITTERVIIRKGFVTYCEPQSRLWRYRAPRIELDLEREIGYAHHMTFNIGAVPVFYTPFFRFPLHNRRMSGLLYPRFGSSGDEGMIYHQPWYWNIAPNYDATLYLTAMRERGMQWSLETRALSPHTFTLAGYAYLPHDARWQDEEDGHGPRSLAHVQHQGNFANGRYGYALEYNDVSDQQYLADLPNVFGLTDTKTLPRELEGYWREERWQLRGGWYDYQVARDSLNYADYPFARLPRLMLDYRWDDLRLHGDYNRFTRDIETFLNSSEIDDGLAVHGERYDTSVVWERRVHRPWGYVTPRAAWRRTAYALEDQAIDKPASPLRETQTFSLDSGLIFERTRADGGMQTLEPRWYFVHTPFVDQNDLPDFDSARRSISYAQLFRPNRFSGGDRVEDARRISVGASSQVFTPNGQRRWLWQAARAFHLAHREVTLDADDDEARASFAQTRAQSPLFLGGYFTPDDIWEVRAEFSWHQQYSTLLRQSLGARYVLPRQFLFDAHYARTLNEDSLAVTDQSDISYWWALSPAWKLFGRYRYDHTDNQEKQFLRGLEYADCCWRVRFGAFTERNDDDDYDRGLNLQFTFTAVASFDVIAPRDADVENSYSVPEMLDQINGLKDVLSNSQ